MTETSNDLVDALAELDDVDRLAVRRAILAGLPAAKEPHLYQPDNIDTGRCSVCGKASNAKPHRGNSDPAAYRRDYQEAMRRLLAKYRADDEAVYQSRWQETFAEVRAERA